MGKLLFKLFARPAPSLFLLLFLSSSAVAQAPLRWGADPSGGAPYVYADPAHPEQYIGYEKEMVEALAAAMGRRAVFVPAEWASLVSALERGQFDVIVNGLEPTADRAQLINFSTPYYVFNLQLTVRQNETRINSLDDCKGRRVGTLVNTAASRLLESKDIDYRPYEDPVGAYADLEIGRIDVVLMDVPMEMFYTRGKPRLKRAGEPFRGGYYVIGLRKGDDALKREVDAAIVKIITDGSLEAILRKWNLWDEAQAALKTETVQDATREAAGETVEKRELYDIGAAAFNWGGALRRLGHAALITILLAFGAMAIALALGLLLAIGQTSGPRPVKWFSTVYVEFFRGTPVLVQLLFLYFGLPKLGVAMPGWLTALVGLGLNYAAYESQVYRAALDAVPRGQWEAAYLLNMSPILAFRRIILPQAFRVALPPMTNDFVSLFKDTSVAFAISVWELATAYRELANASGEFLLLGVIVSIFYLVMSLPLAHLARRLELRMRRRRTTEATGEGAA